MNSVEMMDFVLNMMELSLQMMEFVLQMMEFVLTMMECAFKMTVLIQTARRPALLSCARGKYSVQYVYTIN